MADEEQQRRGPSAGDLANDALRTKRAIGAIDKARKAKKIAGVAKWFFNIESLAPILGFALLFAGVLVVIGFSFAGGGIPGVNAGNPNSPETVSNNSVAGTDVAITSPSSVQNSQSIQFLITVSVDSSQTNADIKNLEVIASIPGNATLNSSQTSPVFIVNGGIIIWSLDPKINPPKSTSGTISNYLFTLVMTPTANDTYVTGGALVQDITAPQGQQADPTSTTTTTVGNPPSTPPPTSNPGNPGTVTPDPLPAPDCGTIDQRLKSDFGIVIEQDGETVDCGVRQKVYQIYTVPTKSQTYLGLFNPSKTLTLKFYPGTAGRAGGYTPDGGQIQLRGFAAFIKNYPSYFTNAEFLLIHETGHIITHRDGGIFGENYPQSSLSSSDSSCYDRGYLKTYSLRSSDPCGASGITPGHESFAEASALYIFNHKNGLCQDGNYNNIISFQNECPATYRWIYDHLYGGTTFSH